MLQRPDLYQAETDQQVHSPSPALTLGALRGWLLLILLLITLPYLVAWLTTPDGAVFSGALLNPDDMGVYVSAMRQGAAGKWLYHFPYSPEPWQPRLMLSLYLVMGKVTALVAQPTVAWLHLWRVALSLVTLWLLLRWVRAVFPSHVQHQRTAWLLLLFGNGLGWIVILLAPGSARLAPDIGLPEWSPLTALFNTPHFALGVGLITLTFTCLLMVEKGGRAPERWRWTAAAALVANAAALVYVYHLAVIGLTIGLVVALRIMQRRPWRDWLPLLVVALSLVPLLAYYAFGGADDPYWQQYTRQDHVIPPPTPAAVLVGFGALGALALAGARRWLRQRGSALLPLWAVANLAALYAPGVAFSGRFALGLSIPVATLAAVGLEDAFLPALVRSHFVTRFSRQPSVASMRRITFYLLVPSTVVTMLLFFRGPQMERGFPYYLPQADVRAAAWLGDAANESSLTFAYYPLGNYLPQVYDGKVFMGQADYTTELAQKLALFEQFWNGSLSSAEQSDFLREWEIDFIFAGAYEAPYRRAAVPPEARVVYQEEGVTIYAVR